MHFNQHLAMSVIAGQQFDVEEVVRDVLMPASSAYYNDDESPLTDAQFDFIQRLVRAAAPAHEFFTGIGADVRGEKIVLPFQLGSLNQVEVGTLAKWIKDCGLKATDTLVVSAKLDGSSGAAVLRKDGSLRIAYSRGNGIEGADITRHLKHTIRIPSQTMDEEFSVRGENIIERQAFFDSVQPNFKTRAGKQYVNPRNAVAGFMNADKNNVHVYKYIDFVAYQALGRDDMDKEDQLLELEEMGFTVPWYDVVTVSELSEQKLAEMIDELRATYPYEVDGVVVDVNEARLRKKLDPEAMCPGYAMKYKTLSDDNSVQTEVVEVEWNASKHSYGKPRVIVKAAQLPGITWTYATGYNAKWIVENGIGPGAIVVGARMGDVVPNIIQVVKSVEPQMPDGKYRWTDTGVDIIFEGEEVIERVLTMQLTEVARSLDIDGLRQGTAETLVTRGNYEDFNDMFGSLMSWPRKWWVDVVGSNGGKIYDDMHDKLKRIPLSDWLGSMPHFGRGVGKRKMRALCDELNIKTLEDFNQLTARKIVGVEGFADRTAHKIIAGMSSHAELFKKLEEVVAFEAKTVTGQRFAGQKIVFTGFRDAGLEKLIEQEGGEMQTSVSAKTTMVVAASIVGSSGKLKKVHDLNASGKAKIELIDIATFRKMYVEQQTGLEF